MRMLERSGELDLAAEPLHVDTRCQLRREDLDNHLPSQGGLSGYEDPTHSAAAELALDGVRATQRALETVSQIRHPRLVAVPPYLTAVISARIASAVSAGWRPPRSKPMGPWSRSSWASVIPDSRSRSRRAAWVFLEPIAPT